MEMFDLRADYKTLPDETLRRHFRRLIKRQRRFAAFTFALLIPAVIIYSMDSSSSAGGIGSFGSLKSGKSF